MRRLFMSKINRPVMSLARLIRQMKAEVRADKIAVVVGTISNDLRVFEVPKIKVSTKRLNSQLGEGLENCPRFPELCPF